MKKICIRMKQTFGSTGKNVQQYFFFFRQWKIPFPIAFQAKERILLFTFYVAFVSPDFACSAYRWEMAAMFREEWEYLLWLYHVIQWQFIFCRTKQIQIGTNNYYSRKLQRGFTSLKNLFSNRNVKTFRNTEWKYIKGLLIWEGSILAACGAHFN